MQVRIATIDEVPALQAIEDSGDELFGEYGYPPFPPESYADDWGQEAVLLAVGEPAVGFVRIDLVNGEPYIEQLSVLPSHGRQGIGTALMEAAEQWARDNGHARVWLTTFLDVPWNGPFYAARGYEVAADPIPGLAEIRHHEIEAGLDEMGPRAALVKRLAG